MTVERVMCPVVIAAAQCAVRDRDIGENIRRHLCFMHLAREHGVQVLVFPELSLTGYEPAFAASFAQGFDPSLIAPLRSLSREAKMTTVVGLPFQPPGQLKPLIAAFVLHADGALTVYTKRHLHQGEQACFAAGSGGDLLKIGGVPLALSICADFGQPSHPAEAARAGARMYVSSALISPQGYAADSATLQGYSQLHRMAVLMANHGGPTGGWSTAGCSAFWDENGQLAAATPEAGNHLLVVSGNHRDWRGFSTPVAIAG